MKIRALMPLATATAVLIHTSTPASAGSMSASPTAPPVDDNDIANYGAVTGNEKWWAENNTVEGSCKGQTFTTGIAAVELRSITYEVAAERLAEPTKTYVVRVGTVVGTTFSQIHSEEFTQEFTWDGGDFMTWTFDNPPLLNGNTTYAIDIGMTHSTSIWQTGIPYINVTANSYLGGDRYSSGQFGVGDAVMHVSTNSDRIFHLDLGVPGGIDLEFVAGNPPDDTVDAVIHPELVATFNQVLVTGTGTITIWDLNHWIDTPIAIDDPRVSLSENVLLIATEGLIEWGTDYAIWIDYGALVSDTGEIFEGIADLETWNFNTAPEDPLLAAIEDLKEHINGVPTATLTGPEIAARKDAIDAGKHRFDETADTITAVFDLVTTYDAVFGPLFLETSTATHFDRESVSDQDIHWVVFNVMQYILDEVYNAATLADPAKLALIDGFMFGSSADFPGSVVPPDPFNTHHAVIDASFLDTFGRNTQHWTRPARKPTGAYLAPGTTATVAVPPELVGAGYQVRIGAHSWDHEAKNRPAVERLSRATILYALTATTVKVASPYGGGIYIEVPFGADAGLVTVDITGAERSPYFSDKSFYTTTIEEWLDTERNHPAPWADFQTDKFMMQVPTSWISDLQNPDTLMADWDAAVDAMNDLMGYPYPRGKETLYLQVDVINRSAVNAPGYPSVNNTYDPDTFYDGYHDHFLVRGPQFVSWNEFHAHGHGYFFPKFDGERESAVNLPHVAVWHRKFGYDLDYAFAASLGFEGNPHRTRDNTAIAWMTSFNFSPREVEMDSDEKDYQLKGHAKFIDIVHLFGWEVLDAFWYSLNEDEENGITDHGDDDDKLLRLSQSVGEDIRPLFHFWGIFPDDPYADWEGIWGLAPSPRIYNLLRHYKSIVPADNAAFHDFAYNWWGDPPDPLGYWTESEHGRQWDDTPWFVENNDVEQRPCGEIYTGESDTQLLYDIGCPDPESTPRTATEIEARVQEIIDLYFGGLYLDDYEAWAALWPEADLIDPNADFDGDGVTNDVERVFGLDPTSASSVSPLAFAPASGEGALTYTQRELGLTGMAISVWCSYDLESWFEDTGAVHAIPGSPNAYNVETVSLDLSPDLLTEERLFVQLRALE